MEELLEIIKKLMLGDSFITILGIIFTTFLTYYFTKRMTINTKNQEIYNIQLNKIYLPLHNQVFNKNIDDIDVALLLKTLKEKTLKYNLYCSNKLIRITNRLINEVQMNKVSIKTLKYGKLYIENEFYFLKYRLGYPCNINAFFGNKYALFTIIKYVWCFIQVFIVSIFSIYIILGTDYYGYDALRVFETSFIFLIMFNYIFTTIIACLFFYNWIKWKW